MAFKRKETNTKIEEIRQDDPSKMLDEQAVIVGQSVLSGLQGRIESYNPDRLVRTKGYHVYSNMMRDDQVKAALMLKLGIMSSRSMTFDVTDDSQKECQEFFENNITYLLKGNWKKAIKTILMGKAWGFSINEKLFRSTIVEGKPRWILDQIKQKPWHTFEFEIDKFGNKVNIYQNQDSTKAPMNPDKFIHYVSMPEMDELYGESDLKAAYKPYWEKDVINKFWNVYLERMAGGFVVASPNERLGNMSDSEKLAFEKVLKNISGSTGIRVPNGYDLAVEMPSTTDAYEKAIDKKDVQIARALMIPNFLGFTEQGNVGSNAQASVVLDMFMMIIEEEIDYLADVLNEQLFAQLAYWNFGLEDYPRAKFTPYTTEQKRAIAKVWLEAVKGNVVTNTVEDEIYTRDLLLYPTIDKEKLEEEKVKAEEKARLAQEAMLQGMVGKVPVDPEEKEDKEVEKPETNKSENSGINDGIILQPQKDWESPMFIDRIDFTELGNKLDSVEVHFFKDLSAATDIMFKDLKTTFMQIAEKSDGKAIDSEKINNQLTDGIGAKSKSHTNRVIREYLKSTYVMGRNSARLALMNAVSKLPKQDQQQIKKMVLLTEQKACTAKDWSVANFIDGISIDAAESWFSSQAFTITGDLTSTMIKKAARIMIDGIRDEKSVKQMVDELDESLPTIVKTSDNANRSRLETIVRTNMSTIFTQSQVGFYVDPDLNGFVEGFEYSSILDDRTTEVCGALDGAKYPVTDPIWSHITPPNHFNCRSVLIPITMYDDWRKSTRKYKDDELPADGFGSSSFPEKYLE